MDRYRIGRVEGRWHNFLPPIQGGIFHSPSATESHDEKHQASVIPVSSSASSRSQSPSPIFDNSEARHRSTGSSSPSSVSSWSEQEVDDGTAFLDAKTGEAIRLDLDKYPSLDDRTQEDIIRKYRLLNDRIKAEGLYQCNYRAYAWEMARYTLLFSLMLLFLRWKWYALSAVFLGVFWHQITFTAHDAGHMGITHNFHVDTLIGALIADFIGGLSIGWWKRNHNVHHIVTNSPEHDPDIEYIPFFAVSHRMLQSLRSTYYDTIMEYDALAKILIPIQAWTYYIIMLFGRFNLYRLAYTHLFLSPRPKGPGWWHWYVEAVGQVAFWAWFGYGIIYRAIDSNWARLVFILISHMGQAPLHVQLTLSHFAMSTANLGPDESFPQRMLRTTMDVDCPPWLDFFHGGLQFQVVHHLFPRVPRHNLRRAQKLVQRFCDDVGIPYALYGFVDANVEVVGRLAEVGRQATILAKCQQSMVKQGNHHHVH